MANIIVTAPFRDIDNFDRLYSVGEVVSVSEDRAQTLISLNLAKAEAKAETLELKAEKAATAEKSEVSDNNTKKRKSSV